MGKRGPAPKPTRLRELQGNPARRPLVPDLSQPSVGTALRCPTWLHKFAKAKWKELAPKLLALGLLSEMDGESLALACQAWANFRLAVESENKTAEREASERWRKASALFGLSPADRARVKTTGVPAGAVDPIMELLERASTPN